MDGLDGITETAGAAAVEIAVSALLERGGRVRPCTNCSARMIGAYCAACGQPLETHRRSIVHLLHDLFKDIASFDSGILRCRDVAVSSGRQRGPDRSGRALRLSSAGDEKIL